MVREIESTDAKYTEEEMKERINAEKELQMFPRLEFGDPGVFEVRSYWKNIGNTFSTGSNSWKTIASSQKQ